MPYSSPHPKHMLAAWEPEKDRAQWVLGVIYKTEGSCYRKSGAMMLFSDQGHQLGLLSGGCLESDVARNARKVMADGCARTLVYDDSDEDDTAFQLGVGCGGAVYLLLLPVHQGNAYLSLDKIRWRLDDDQSCYWQLEMDDKFRPLDTVVGSIDHSTPKKTVMTKFGERQCLQVRLEPLPHLLVIGGGTDAIPLTRFAALLGWQVSLWDARPGHGRAEHFPHVDHRLDGSTVGELRDYVNTKGVHAAVLMTHHRVLDADALRVLHDSDLFYLALLGPPHRKQEMIELAGIDSSNIKPVFHGPAGLPIGGELPESIALSILAQCHQVLYEGRKFKPGAIPVGHGPAHSD